MSQLRAAIVGVGRIADMHAPGYLSHPDATIAMICDLDRDLLERRKREWRVEKTVTDFRAVLDAPDIDLVEIITPHHLHCEMVKQVAAAGKHISVQKPMALTVAECDEMIDAAKQAGVKLKVFENFVFYPPYRRAKAIVENGDIGDVLGVRFRLGSGGGGWYVPLTTWVWRANRKLCGPGPDLFDDGNHKFSQAIDLLGPIQEVWGYIDWSLGVIDSPAVISWNYKEHDAVGAFDAGFMLNMIARGKYYGADERIDITGTKGSVVVTRCTAQVHDEPPLWVIKNGRAIGHEDLRSDWMDSFTDSTHHMIDALKNDTEPKLTGERGREVLAFSLAAYESAETGKRVRPDEIGR